MINEKTMQAQRESFWGRIRLSRIMGYKFEVYTFDRTGHVLMTYRGQEAIDEMTYRYPYLLPEIEGPKNG